MNGRLRIALVSVACAAGVDAAAAAVYASGDVTTAGDLLAMNFLLDRSAEGRARDLARLKAEVGGCRTDAPLVPTGALSGDFTWRCDHGRLKGSILLAPTRPPRIQSLSLTRENP